MRINRKLVHLLRVLSKYMRGKEFFYQNTFESHTNNYQRTLYVVRLYYAVSVGIAVSTSNWAIKNLTISQFSDPLWPFFNLDASTIQKLVPIFFYLWTLGSLAAFINIHWRWARVASGIGIFYIGAMFNSDGHFAHNYHAIVWASFILMFLPAVPELKDFRARVQRHRYIQTFWFIHFGFGVLYFMTGLWKFRGIFECMFFEQWTCEISKNVLANIAAHEHVFYRKFSPYTWLLFSFPWVGFISYLGVLWIHIFSLHFAFRPSLHGIYGVIRVIFHLGTFVLFGVNFTAMTVAVTAVFLFSPFQTTSRNFMDVLSQLPPLDQMIKVGHYLRSLRAVKS